MKSVWRGTIVTIILVTLLGPPNQSAADALRFQALTVADGLSQNTVNAILQDSKGFMWFGTQDGLNCYDGHRFTIYKADRFTPNTLSSSFITTLCEDRSGTLWIGTMGGGVNRLGPDRSRFERFLHQPQNKSSLSNNTVMAICEDAQGVIWVGTVDGLNRFDTQTGQFLSFHSSQNPQQGLFNDLIYALTLDKQGNMWIGTLMGLLRLDKNTRQFKLFRASPLDMNNITPQITTALLAEANDKIWVGTNGGLYLFNSRSETFTLCLPNPTERANSPRNFISTLTLDDQGGVFLGTQSGLLRYDPRSRQQEPIKVDTPKLSFLMQPDILCSFIDPLGSLWIGSANGIRVKHAHQALFDLYRHESDNPNTLSHPNVRAIYEDEAGTIWLGTVNGLNAFDRQTRRMTRYLNTKPLSSNQGEMLINWICGDGQGGLWLATDKGLKRFDAKRGGLCSFPVEESRETSGLIDENITCVLWDPKDGLWFGSFGQLNLLDPQSGKLTQWRHDATDPSSLSGSAIFTLFKDSHQRLWLGSNGGLNRLQSETESKGKTRNFEVLRIREGQVNGIGSDFVMSICEDAQGILWLGTGAGLDRFDPVTGTFTHYSERNGLPNNTIYGILPDNSGQLWLSSNRGLCRFDPAKETFRSYGLDRNLQDLEFNSGAAWKCRDGSLLFGGVNGFNHFDPRNIRDNPLLPPLAITRVEILPRKAILTGFIPSGKELVLEPGDTLLNIEFAALNYNDPEANRYAYKIEGLHSEWIDLGYSHSLSLSGLPAGKHTFRVKGSNNDGVWNEAGAFMIIVVRPPFWRSWWFLTLLAAALLVAAYRLGAGHRQRQAQKIKSETDLKAFGAQYGLSAREQEVILLVLAGKSNKEIEDLLYLAESTIKNHIYNIYRKLGVKNRAHLVAFFRNLKK